jgi:diguanylate cyclase (GGDEF)-like protein
MFRIPFRWQVAALPALCCLGMAAVTAMVVVQIVTARMEHEAGRKVAARAVEIQLLAMLRASQEAAADRSAAALRTRFEEIQRSVPSYAWIGFVDADGRIEAATGGLLEGVEASSRPVYQQGRKGLWFGDVHPAVMLDRLLRQPGEAPLEFVDVAAPVHDAQGALLGVVAGHLGWKWAGDVRREILGPHEDRHRLEVVVVASNGNVLLGPDGMLQAPLGFDPAALARNERGWGLHVWPDGMQAITAVATSGAHHSFPGLGWTVLARQPQDVAIAEARILGRRIMGWGALVALGFLGLGLWLAGRVAQPVHAVLKASRRLRHAGTSVDTNRRVSEVSWVADLLRSMDEDLDSRARQVRRLKHEATHDPLTGLPNRAFLSDLLERVHPPQRGDDHEVVLLGFDLDGFKQVNDTRGHSAGDAVLKAVAARLKSTLRDGDVAVRMGGDEFLVIVEAAPGHGDELADSVAARLVEVVAEPLPFEGHLLAVGCSIGVTVWRSHGQVPLHDALLVVDRAMYRAKEQGKGRWVRMPLEQAELVDG